MHELPESRIKRGINVSVEVKSMEIKKPKQATERFLAVKQLQDFVADIKGEIKKITWTSREELMVYTKIVVLMTFVFGMAIYGLDLLIQSLLSSLTIVLHLIAG